MIRVLADRERSTRNVAENKKAIELSFVDINRTMCTRSFDPRILDGLL